MKKGKNKSLPFSLFWKISRGYISITGVLFFVPGIAYLGEWDLGFNLNKSMWLWISVLFSLMGLVILVVNARRILNLYNLLFTGVTSPVLLTEIYESETDSGEKVYKYDFQIKTENFQYTFSETSDKLDLKMGQYYLAIFKVDRVEDARVIRLISPELETYFNN